MIMNEMKTNTGKLLVAVLAMAMLIAGAAIVFSDNVNAAVNETDVAQIGDEGYVTLDEAVEVAQPGDTISLLKNVTLTKTITAIGLKIEGNNHTINTGEFKVNFQGAGCSISNVTLNSSKDVATIDVSGNAAVVIDNCQFTGTSTTAVYVNFAETTDVEIKDSAISDNVMKEVILALGANQKGNVEINNCTGLRVNVADATAASGITLGDELVINDSPVDRLNVDTPCTVTIAQGDVFTANLIRGTGTIVNNGTVVANGFSQTDINSGKEIKITGNYAFRIPAGMTAVVSGNSISVDGTPVSVSDATYKAYFSTAAGAANTYAGIVGLSGENVKITQKNPYLAIAYPGADKEEGSGFINATTKEKEYDSPPPVV